MLRIERARPWLVTAVAVGLLTVGTAATAVAEDRLVLDQGHIDAFALTWTDNTLDVRLQEDVTGSHVLHPPEDVLLKVKPDAALELPDPVPPSLSFLGQPGDTIYYLPQTQDPNLIWPGWNTERVPGGVFTNPLRIQVTDVAGPGEVFLWQTGAVGQPISVLGGGFQLPGTISANAGVHAHAEWAFTEEGTYSFTVVASGELAGGGTATSAPRTYTFQVGDATEPPPATTLSVTGLADHYHSGDVVTLTAVQDPVTELDHYHWFTRAAGSDEWVIVPNAGGGQYSFTATAQHDGLQVIARLYDHDHAVVAESAPVTVVVDDHGQQPATTLSVTGLADHYHSGDVVTLTAVQDPVTELDHYHWFTRAAGADAWVIVPDAGGGEYSFTATAQHNGLQVIARLYDHDHAVVAESEPVTVVVDDHGGSEPPAPASQDIVVTLADDAGALVISVDPDDRRVLMSDLELGTSGDRWVSSGDLRPVTVTDTRAAAPGWAVSAQVGDFSSGAGTLRGGSLGWTPVVTQQPDGAGVTAGPPVASGFASGDGLSVASTLASAAPGGGVGTSKLGAGLAIEAPTSLKPGTYTATITFTVI